MKLLLSPAKLMDLKTEKSFANTSIPAFISQSEIINKKLKSLNPNKLAALQGISQKLANENWERNQQWNSSPKIENSIPAIFAFKGEVFRGLEIQSISEDNYNYLIDNIFILSGLYGILKPNDWIMLYRLEMGTKISIGKHKNLYEFWQKKLTEYLNKKVENQDVIINLASKEYASVIDRKLLKSRIIDVDFKENRNGKLMSIMSFFKNARGKIAKYCIENEIVNPEKVKDFTVDNYLFSEEFSKENHWVFIR